MNTSAIKLLNNNEKIVRFKRVNFVSRTVNINSQNNEGNAPLHIAAKLDSVYDIGKLASTGADVNVKNNEGNTPLHMAARSDSVNAISKLKSLGADVNAKNDAGNTPLHIAARSDSINVISKLKSLGADVNAKNDAGNTPLHMAARSDSINVISKLKSLGADVNVKNNLGNTPLHIAARGSNVGGIRTLRFLGADINAKNDAGNTPLHSLITLNRPLFVMNLFHDHTLGSARALIDLGADINAKNNRGNTPLHQVAFYANEGIIPAADLAILFLKNGAHINEKNNMGITPLHGSASFLGPHSMRILTILHERGGNINSKDNNGNTVLDSAIIVNNKDACRTLLNLGVSLELQDYNMSSFHKAILYKRHKIVDMIKDHIVTKEINVKVNDITYNEGNNPLHTAVMNNDVQVIKQILSLSSVKDIIYKPNRCGLIPLQQAIFNDCINCAKKILDHIIDSGFYKNYPVRKSNKLFYDILLQSSPDFPVIKYLVEEKKITWINNMEYPNNSLIIPLIQSIYHNNLELFKYVLDKVVSISNVKENYLSANKIINIGIIHNRLDIVEYFIDQLIIQEADLKFILHNRELLNLDHDIKINGIPFIEKILLKQGLFDKISLTDSEGNSVLHIAASIGNTKTFSTLMDYGCNVNAENNKGYTPVMLAIEFDNIELLKFALESNKVNLEQSNPIGNNLLHLALINNKYEAASIILTYAENKLDAENYNLFVKKENTIGQTPFDLGEDRIQSENLKNRFIGTKCITSNRVKISKLPTRCLISWDKDIEKFNAERIEPRNYNKIKVDSEKFFEHLSSVENSPSKRAQLIQFIDEVTDSPGSKKSVTGRFQNQIDQLVNNARAMQHFKSVEHYSKLAMYGMIGKSIVGNFIQNNYKGVAIGVGLITVAQGSGRMSGLVSTKGLQLISKGKLVQGYALRSVAPFFSHLTSMLSIYGLIHETADLKAGNKDALVGIIGHSTALAIDLASIGIELAEIYGLISGVSSVTGPIASVAGTVIFIGTEIYISVKKIEKIKAMTYLTPSQEFLEGLRTFIGFENSKYIYDLIQKDMNNKLVKEWFDYIKKHGIKRYVFSSYEGIEHCKPIKFLGLIPYRQSCTKNIQIASDNSVFLDKKVTNITWSKTIPEKPDGLSFLCLPEGKKEEIQVPDSGAHKCVNAIGISTDIPNTNDDNTTIIDLGKGTDYVVGFPDSPNIFIIDNGIKFLYGGNYDDNFILQGKYNMGYVNGSGGSNTLSLNNFRLKQNGCIELSSPKKIPYRINREIITGKEHMHYLLSSEPHSSEILFTAIHNVIGRKNKCDKIEAICDLEYVNLQGGENNSDKMDKIIIPDKKCFHKTKVELEPNTVVLNSGLGNFTYMIQPGNGLIKIDVINTKSWNNFIFNYSLSDIQISNIKNNQTNSQIYLQFNKVPKNDVVKTEINVPLENNNIIYELNDGTEIKKIQNILYAYQISNKSTNDIIKDYTSIAESSGMFILAKSTVSNETITIGNRNEYILNGTTFYTSNVMNNHPSSSNHLVGGKSENMYIITSGYEIIDNISQLKIPDTTIHEPNESNLTDILDLTYLDKQLSKDLGINLELKLKQDGDDILIEPFIPNHEQKEEQNVTCIRLKDGIKNNFYKRLQVILNRSRMIIEYNNNNFSLTPLPLAFDKDTSIIIITPQDVDKNTKLEIPKQAGKYSFYRSEKGLIITNVDTFVEEKNWYTISLIQFYEEYDMQKISIKFNDKEIFLEKEMNTINNAEYLYELTEKINNINNILNEVNQIKKQHTIDSEPNIYESPSLTRHRRDTVEYNKDHLQVGNIQEEYIADSASTTFSEPRNNVLNSDPIKPIPSIGPDEYPTNTRNYSIGNIDFNGTLIWFDFLARWFTGYREKPIKDTFSNLEMDIKAKEIAYRCRSAELVDLFVNKIKKDLGSVGFGAGNFSPSDDLLIKAQNRVYERLLNGETKTITDILSKELLNEANFRNTQNNKGSIKKFNEFLKKFKPDLPNISNKLLKKSEIQIGMANTRLKPDLGLLNQSISSMRSVDGISEPALLTQEKHNATYSIASNDTQDVSRYRRSVGM